MSDTPETDDQPIINAINDNGYQVPCVDADFARKLERERDEAREVASGLAIQEERVNETQKELSSIHRWIERNHADGFIDSLTYLQNLERVTDCWYDRLDKIERERDEARKQNAKLREIADALAVALERLDALYRSEQDPEAPMLRPDWLRRPLQMIDAELDQIKEGAK
jgi:transcriptional regulator with XRE-family HTH domain